MKTCLCGCGRTFPDGVGKAKKKAFFSDKCRADFSTRARRIGEAKLKRQAKKRTGVPKKATPAERLGLLAQAAAELGIKKPK